MEKVGLFHFVAEPYLMDFRGRVTLPMIGNYLIHAASSHAGERGFGFNDMSERHTAWVLSRLAIEMKEYPTAFDKINLYTWIDEVGRLFTSRCFELADENGKTFGFARSIWAAIDVETRRPTLLDIARLSAYVMDRPCHWANISTSVRARSRSRARSCRRRIRRRESRIRSNTVTWISTVTSIA